MLRSPISRFSRRDVLLILTGATAMYVLSTFFAPFSPGYTDNIVINAHLHNPLAEVDTDPLPPPPELKKPKPPKTVTTTSVETKTVVQTTTQVGPAARPTYHGLNAEQKVLHEAHSAPISLPLTSILHHAPGWTLFENIYMSNGTLFVVTETGDYKEFPEKLNMISTGLTAENTPENIAARLPTDHEMSFLTVKEATRRWAIPSSKSSDSDGSEWRIRTVEGNTILFNDPRQFLRHYYHFIAELWFGVQAFWDGAFAPKSTAEVKYDYPFLSSFSSPFDKNQPPPKLSKTDKNQKNPNSLLTIQSLPSDYAYHAEHKTPPIDRAIFIHSNADGWRDGPGFNRYFLRAAYPSLTVEYEEDWQDRVQSTIPHDDGTGRAFHFPLALLADRSAAHKGDICGSQTQRTASEAWEYMFKKGQLRGWRVGGWWADVRESILRWAGVSPEYLIHPESHLDTADQAHEHTGKDVASTETTLDLRLPLPHDNKIVITYISRQSAGHRKLLPDSHKGLVDALEALVKSRTKEGAEWEFIPVEAEKLSKDEQMAIIAKTTILLGVHGNGLSHLVFMPPTRYSTVIEIFFPGGTANDYLWTTRALGMRHWAVWDDKYYTFPNRPPVDYPKGFQDNEIPVNGQAVAQLIADRVDGLI